MHSIYWWAVALIGLVVMDHSWAITIQLTQDWLKYKDFYNKDYSGPGTTEALAQYYYTYNKLMIDNHNALYERNLTTYKLCENQFTDMRLIHFNAMFPQATPLDTSFASPGPDTIPAPPAYDPAKHFGYMFNVEDQGTKCNSGWAYAAAKAVEILQAQQAGEVNPQSLSAQNFIDCAGAARACRNQVPQTAFDYMTKHDMDLLEESEYPNNNSLAEPGMCVPRGAKATNLAQYSTIPDGDDEAMLKYVAAGFPVVVEVNPNSFAFMHYGGGVYRPPNTRNVGSHFMVVIGYDTDKELGKDYWILQNSFDTTWGEGGLMRFERSPSVKLAKNAIFPTQLA